MDMAEDFRPQSHCASGQACPLQWALLEERYCVCRVKLRPAKPI